MPPIEDQRRIASVLTALDDKIDSNARLIRLLDQVATMLFSGRVVPAMDHDHTVESELGPLPAGFMSPSIA